MSDPMSDGPSSAGVHVMTASLSSFLDRGLNTTAIGVGRRVRLASLVKRAHTYTHIHTHTYAHTYIHTHIHTVQTYRV